MENEDRYNIMEHAKPKLTVDEQIAHLKGKGVRFEICSESEARNWLERQSFYFDIAAYRVLFDKYVGGDKDGMYIDLDFGYLVELDNADRLLRETLFSLTQNVEQTARANIVHKVTEDASENGYSIVAEYLTSLSCQNRKRREQELSMLDNDVYSGNLVKKYGIEPPVWVFVELLSFGAFVDFCLFCGKRWNDKIILDDHYLLRQSKMIRNAAAHGSAIINGLGSANTRIRTNQSVSRALAAIGISNHQRSTKLKNSRLQQIASLLFLHSKIVENQAMVANSKIGAERLIETLEGTALVLDKNDTVRSSFQFLVKLLKSWILGI